MSAPSTMHALAQAYLAERRQLGFELDRSGSLTLAFASFADGNGHVGPLTAKIVLRWAKEGASRADPFTWAGRVAVLRPFARYLADHEPKTEFPEDAPFGRSHRRLAPHIYSLSEVEALVAAAKRLPGRLKPATYAMLFGLLAATGLRISEALRLRIRDIDESQAQLTVLHGKFQRSRLVPLHPSATKALRTYLRVRASHGSMEGSAALFLCERTYQPLTYGSVRSAFRRLTAELRIPARGGHQFVRIHDL
ncbi:tyrosine-type recombinase/integrase [Sphingomonas sp. PAMC 26617]|uniref:tyrosine-type recombinase/integrase n=1 Tax=Sphingomonas sp. PAMC 26617 TaxID=1112216 RepID=UPI0009DAA5EB|nr:tyrosine-type recombinase/integrase [Sphingomonas sp. PAMC 26617]